MNRFDKYVKSKAAEKPVIIPLSVENRVNQALAGLPETKHFMKPARTFPRMAAAAVCCVFLLLFLLPNISVSYAKALEKIPVIGDLVRVITIRNYFYSDDYHQMDIDVPKIEGENSDAFDFINKEAGELTEMLVRQFYNDLEIVGDQGHGSIFVDYEVITDTTDWFTLKIRVNMAAGSGNISYKYYNVNKQTGRLVQLEDIADDDGFYEAIKVEIERQMREEMRNDSSKVYWIDGNLDENSCVVLDGMHNFYMDEKGNLVISFDKYEVAPGSMGTPAFIIEKAVWEPYAKPEFLETIS